MKSIFTLKELDSIPKISGLYYLYDESKLLYIGRAFNIRYRLKQHQKANFWCTRFYGSLHIEYAWNQITKIVIESIDKRFLKIVEKLMIFKFKPLLNTQTRQFYFNVDEYLDRIDDKESKELRDYWKEVTKAS